MSNIWANSAVVYPIAILAAAGLAAILYGAYHFWAVKGNKKQIEEGEAITIVVVLFFAGIVGTMFLVNCLVNDAKEMQRQEQNFNCSQSLTVDGKELTESQCQYFQDVLNGKYIDKGVVEDIEDSKHIDD